MKNHLMMWSSIAIALVTLTSCGAKDIDKVGDAQICLDTSTPATVSNCTALVTGMESTAAYNIRCAAKFIAEGFNTPTKYTNAFTALNSNTSNVSAFMSLITFYSAGAIATDTTNSSNAFSYCYKSGGKGSTLIAAFTYSAMALYQYMATNGTAYTCSTTPGGSGYDLSTCITNWAVIGNATQLAQIGDANTANASAQTVQSAIGSVIITTYLLSCTTSTGANQTLCSSLSTAITNGGGTGNPRGVAVQFITALGVH